ncbi:hypothetical protein DL96DRAFT_1552032 [Flagelloscypha sp. PMI_526]|nr:hypothetical protein DL96DRAFT_1552032 [Flagelloscypha sp. PMI_526]
MANIGSVFLGDTRRRFLSGSTPPSSPPATATSPGIMTSLSPSTSPEPILPLATQNGSSSRDRLTQPPPPIIDPELSLELRLRWLEALLVGLNPDKKTVAIAGMPHVESKPGVTVSRAVEDVKTRLKEFVDGNDGLKRFMDQYDQHAHLLTPSFALSGLLPDPPAYEDMSSTELNLFLGEMENEVRAADRDLREIEALEQKGVLEAGRLGEHTGMQPRLEALLKAQEEDLELAGFTGKTHSKAYGETCWTG